MIMTASELRQYISTDESDGMLKSKLSAIEMLIRAYTNNNFQARAYRSNASAVSENFIIIDGAVPYKAGDTLQITQSDLMPDCLVTIESISDSTITVLEDIVDEPNILITKVVYPMDIKMGVVNMIKWELANRDKVGVASESISRHSVTYFDMNGDNSSVGYPKALVGFLKPYIKARFGKGLSV